MKILAINPGSTSTKIAVYDGRTPQWILNIKHTPAELAPFADAMAQLDYRKNLVLAALQEKHTPLDFAAVIGRGGLSKPVKGGVYVVNDAMLHDCRHATRRHACNLGCLIAKSIADSIDGCTAYMADPGVVDELEEVARVTGLPAMPRITIWHALNQRAVARRYAAELTEQRRDTLASAKRGTSAEKAAAARVRYEDLDLIVCHLGGGVSIGAHRHGRCIDVNNALDGEGPFSPERAGTLPVGNLIDMCYSGQFTREEMKQHMLSRAGLVAHLGTNDVPAIVERIYKGDAKAKLVVDAMAYQIAKAIGGAAVALRGHVDAILLTGGMAHAEYVISRIREQVKFLAPVKVYPGEDEMDALAQNAYGAMTGKLRVREYK